jgi:hypothetical protein
LSTRLFHVEYIVVNPVHKIKMDEAKIKRRH